MFDDLHFTNFSEKEMPTATINLNGNIRFNRAAINSFEKLLTNAKGVTLLASENLEAVAFKPKLEGKSRQIGCHCNKSIIAALDIKKPLKINLYSHDGMMAGYVNKKNQGE